MDEALRGAQRRGDDPCERATTLRRLGQFEAARRALSDASRAGRSDAATLLEAWFPVDPRLGDLLGWIEALTRLPSLHHAALDMALQLVGALDPRVDAALRPLAEWLAQARIMDPWARLVACLEAEDPVQRLSRCLAEGWWSRGRSRAGGAAKTLPQAWLWPEEAERLVVELERSGAAEQGSGYRYDLAQVHVAGRFEAGAPGAAALERAARHPSSRLRLAAGEHGAGQGGASDAVWEGRAPWPTWTESWGLAWRDLFSGAWNRRFLWRQWEGSWDDVPPWERRPNDPTPLADPELWLLYIDVDLLKQVNDVHGMPCGDQVILAVGDAAAEFAGDRVSRWAGDEYMVHWEGDDGPGLAEAIRDRVAGLELPGFGGQLVRPSVTVGVTRGGDFASAFQRADQALSQPRQAGLRGQVRVLV